MGVATQGGRFPPAWRELLRTVIRAGLDVENGLHEFLRDDDELAELAARHDVELRDLRRPPAGLDVPSGANLEVPAKIVLTVGSECAIGKMTVSLELDRAARARGLRSQFVPTGQTGIAIEGWGISVDAVVSDFLAGAAERLVVEGHERGGELLWVEGQGSLIHPAYSGVTLGLVHGSAPHAFVLCHLAGQTEVEGYPGHPIPPLAELVELHERHVAARAQGEGGGDRAQHAAPRRGGRAGRGRQRRGRDRPARRRPGPLRQRAAAGRRARSDRLRPSERIGPAARPDGTAGPSPRRVERSIVTPELRVLRSARKRKGILKKLAAALLLACALTFATTAHAVDFGANDDTGKYSGEHAATFFEQMAAAGLKQNVMTVRWRPSAPKAIPDDEALDRGVAAAVAAGIAPVLAVYPYPPSEIEKGNVSPAEFADWLDKLARRYPEVRTYIVGNEPNLNTFWRAQGNGGGKILSGATFGPFLAAGYDALKSVSSGIKVLGVGSSPRGDRSPGAAGKSSPVHFLASLGAWYRASNRPTRLMDGYSFHPYPNPSDFSVPFSFTYGWPNAGVQELGRIKQALWDAFNGTQQPTTLRGLKLYLDEVGWQVDTRGNDAYEGNENVRVTSEANQAAIYAQLVRFVACDRDVAQLNFFGYYDERHRAGWQSALRRADGSARAANAAVAAAIAQTAGGCTVATRSWSPERGVIGAAADFGDLSKPRPAKQKSWTLAASALEDATYTASILAAGTNAPRG